jgi:hypothetical protein
MEENSEKIWKIWKKPKLNSEKILENTEENCEMISKVSWIVKRYGKCGRNASRIVKWYGQYGRKECWIAKRYGKYGRK